MLKILSKYENELTKGLYILVAIAYCGFGLIGKIIVNVFDINKTIGWKLDISRTGIEAIPYYSFLFFLFAYLIFSLIKIRTHLILSATHLSLIAFTFFILNFWELNIRFILFTIYLSCIIFVVNVYVSIRANKKIV